MSDNPSDSSARGGRPEWRITLPCTWGRLHVREQLAEDSCCAVFLARDTILERDVALKLFATHDESERQRILAEGRAMSRVRHPNIMQVLGAGIHEGKVGVWMERIDGRPLDQVLEQQGPLSASEVATIGRQLCSAVAAIHGAGLVCGRLDPKRAMREDGGRVRLEYAGYVMDEACLAPEISRGVAPGPQSDIFALGALLYRLATGTFPPPGDAGSVPEPLMLCLDQAIADEPANRFHSPAALARALGRASKGPASRARRIAGVTIILALAVLVILQWPSQYRLDTVLFRLEADRTRSGLVAGDALAAGDCVLLEIATTVPMYVYVFSEDAAGNARGLFPTADSGIGNPLAPDEVHVVPSGGDGDTCWKVDHAGDFRRLHILGSPEPVPEFNSLYLALPRSGISDAPARPLVEAATGLDENADIAIGVTYRVIDFQPSAM